MHQLSNEGAEKPTKKKSGGIEETGLESEQRALQASRYLSLSARWRELGFRFLKTRPVTTARPDKASRAWGGGLDCRGNA
jgi:hypothetical protein